jgi:hypothetical protein
MKNFHMNTEIFFGENALDRLSALHFDSVLIISDPFVVSSGMITLLTARLDRAQIRYELFTDVVPDPPVEKVVAGVAVVVSIVGVVIWHLYKAGGMKWWHIKAPYAVASPIGGVVAVVLAVAVLAVSAMALKAKKGGDPE